MLRWGHRGNAEGLLLALYVLVAISLVFAHRCLRLGQPINQLDHATFALADDNLTPPCAGIAQRATGNDGHDRKVCETCTLTTAPVLTAQGDGLHLRLDLVAASIGAPDNAQRATKAPGDMRPRAPPLPMTKKS